MKKKRLGTNRIYHNARSRGSKVSGGKNKRFGINLKKAIVGCIAIVIIGLCLKVYLIQRSELIALEDQKSGLENEITTMQEDIVNLQQEAAKLDDPAYIEIVAREEYGMVGEEDIVFVPARGVDE